VKIETLWRLSFYTTTTSLSIYLTFKLNYGRIIYVN
jgi:hypothetical protein